MLVPPDPITLVTPGYRVRRGGRMPGALAEPVGASARIFDTKGTASRCTAGEPESFVAYHLGPEGRKWIIAVSRSYIAPATLTAPVVSSSVMTGLRLRISAMVSSTFFRATASTKP